MFNIEKKPAAMKGIIELIQDGNHLYPANTLATTFAAIAGITYFGYGHVSAFHFYGYYVSIQSK